MPRKPRKSDSATLGINPRENLLEHRNFLARSLNRNDAEIAALCKLNESLRKAKEAILQSCGEQVLLDIGVGKLKLINEELVHEAQLKKPEMVEEENEEEKKEEEGKEKEEEKEHDGDEDKDDEEAKEDEEKEDKTEDKEDKFDTTKDTEKDKGEEKPAVTEDEAEEEDDDDDESEGVHHLSPAQKDLCVDFLLRMKLRRKLCNRLARRLSRIAHAMDGQDIAPPPPPRYGDLSLNIDPEALKAKEAHWKLLQEAEERLELARKTKRLQEATPPPAPASAPVKAEEEEEEPKKEEAKAPDAAPSATEDAAPKPEPEATEPEAMEVDKTKDDVPSTPVKKEEPAATGEDPDAPPPIMSSPVKMVPMTQAEQDQELLKTYDDAYEKVWDKSTNTFRYTILDEIREPDYAAITDGGVGALTRHMTEEEREAENQRWKSAILARIPRQPTFEELGMKNRVFCLQERLKRCREEAEQEGEAESPSKKPKTEGEDNENAMDVDKDGENKEESKEGEEGAPKKKEGEKEEKKDPKTPEKKNMGAAEKKKEEPPQVIEVEFKPLRPMSLLAVPSFHNQDTMRLRKIQGDMVGQTIMAGAKERMASLVHSYNDALMKSVQCYTRRQQIQQQVALVIEQGRRELAKANSDYTLKVTLCKQKWLQDKKDHDKKRLSTMPSRFNQLATGTPNIQNYMMSNAASHPRLMVAQALGDIVDLTVMQAEGKLSTNTKYPDFVPPPQPRLGQQYRNEQVKMKNEFDRLTSTFNQLEEQRRMKWRKYMAGRAEIELKYGMSSRRTSASYTSLPCPQLSRATQQSIPILQLPVATRAGYTPTNRPPSSDPKYSAAKVKQRIARDGSVAPVSEPKKTKEGLYLRPSGRTRKGMIWDAIRGLWIPEN